MFLVIDHKKLDDNKIFLTTDASDHASGAILSFGPTWETARPVAFDSKSFKDAEINYPTHEKELLEILCGIRKWKVDLLGSPFLYTQTTKPCLTSTLKKICRAVRHVGWRNCLFMTANLFILKDLTTQLPTLFLISLTPALPHPLKLNPRPHTPTTTPHKPNIIYYIICALKIPPFQ